jgi:hypothetical protein
VCERSKGENRRRLVNKCTMQYENKEDGTLLRKSQMNLSKRIENKGKEIKRLIENTCSDIIKPGNKIRIL